MHLANTDCIERRDGREIRTLPAQLMPTPQQRADVAHLLADARVLLAEKPADKAQRRDAGMEALGREVMRLIIARSSFRLDQAQLEAKAQDYVNVLKDVPLWATREAILRWNRGQYPGLAEQEFNFIPQPHRLLKMAGFLRDVLEGQILRYERILAAEPEFAATPEQSEQNLVQLKSALQTITQHTDPDAVETPPPGRPPHTAAQEATDRAESARWAKWLEQNPPENKDPA